MSLFHLLTQTARRFPDATGIFVGKGIEDAGQCVVRVPLGQAEVHLERQRLIIVDNSGEEAVVEIDTLEAGVAGESLEEWIAGADADLYRRKAWLRGPGDSGVAAAMRRDAESVGWRTA